MNQYQQLVKKQNNDNILKGMMKTIDYLDKTTINLFNTCMCFSLLCNVEWFFFNISFL